jgi:hypothetical protein
MVTPLSMEERAMALQGGYRFPVSMADVFPYGVYAMGVEQAMDFDARTKVRTPTHDKQADGQLVWTVTVIDRDPEAREKQVKVKVTAPVQPVLPGEIAPGTGLHAVDFVGMTATPYVVEGVGRGPRMALSFRATAVVAQGKAPGVHRPQGSVGEGKAA